MQNDSSTRGSDLQKQSDGPGVDPVQIDTHMPYWVYRLNSIEWWAAESIDQALEAAAIWHDLPKEELVDELAPPYKLTEEQMYQTLIDVAGVAVPFWFELTRLHRTGEPFPRLFGRSEI